MGSQAVFRACGSEGVQGLLVRVTFVMARKTTPEKIDVDVGDALQQALEVELNEADMDIPAQEIEASTDDLETQISKAANELHAERSEAANGAAPSKSGASSALKTRKPALDPIDALPKPATRIAPANIPAPAEAPYMRAANDAGARDHARTLRNLNRRLPRTIYWLTALLSVGWIVGGAALIYSYYGSALADLTNLRRFIGTPAGVVSAMALAMPVVLFWGFAVMMRRSQEMRIAAQTMAEAAFRLVEPESLGQERVLTVGQAVRREVAAMSEGIERTLARAAELETLVHSEVTEIERAYSDNEVRIRSLVEELGHERDSVISHADRVRASISSAHEQLRDELSAASELIHNNVMNTSTQLTMAINQSGETLVGRINESGGMIHAAIDTRSDEIAARMSTSGEAFASLIDTRIATLNDQADFLSRALSGTFESREQAIAGLFNSASQSFSDAISERSDTIVSQLNTVTTNLNDVLHGGASEVLALVNSSTENLTNEINSRISSLESAVTNRGKALLTEFEARALALDTGTERLNAALDSRARMINETLLERSKDISRTFADGQEKSLALLSETRTGIQGSLVEQTEDLRRVLDERISEIRSTIGMGHQSTADLLKDTQLAMKSGFGNFNGELADMLESRRSGFEGSLSAVRDAIKADLSRTEELLTQTGASLSGNLKGFTTGFDSVYETRRSLFETSLQGVRAALEADLAKAEELLREASTELRESIGGFSDDLGSVIEGKRISLERSLEGAQSRLIADLSRTESLFDDAGAALQTNVDNFASKVDSILDTRQTSFEQTFNNAKAGLEVDLSRTEEALNRTTAGLQNEINSFASNIDRVLEERGSAFDVTLTNVQDSIAANLDRTEAILARAKTGLQDKIEGFTDDLDKVLEERRTTLFGTLDDARQAFTAAIGGDLERIASNRGDIENILRSEIGKIEAAFATQTGAIEERTSTMRRALEMGVETVRKVLEQSAGTVALTLREKVREAADDLAAEAARAGIELEHQGSEFVERVSTRIAQSEQKLSARAETIAGILGETDAKIAERTQQSALAISGHAQQIYSALEDVNVRLDERAAQSASSFMGQSDGIISALDEADQRIMARVHQVSAELDARAGEVERRLASSVSASAGSLSALNERLVEQVDTTAHAMEERTQTLTAMLDSRTREISRILEETAAPLADRMAESGITAATQLEEATKAASERLRRENAHLVQSLASRTSETLAAMESARGELETGVTDLIDRLTASNMNLGQLIELASTNLGGVDKRITDTSIALASSSAALSEHAEKASGALSTSNRILETNVHRLADISNTTLKEVASIASRFDEHGRVLASASDLLNAAQASLSTTLEDRQSSLENLAIGLVKKSEEIEQTLRSFESLVSGAFDRVEHRSTNSSEKIRATVTEVIDQATGRFAEATSEMRQTAASIRSELEATRAELKRGVLELPEETLQSTSKMRRAVSDQINALKELSDIVAKSGRMYDAAPAASAAESRVVSDQQPPRLRPLQPAAAPAPALRGTVEPAMAAAPRPAAPAAAPEREPAAKQTTGWVSDLLRRASTEEEAPKPVEARPPLHVVESLNSLSVDIARAIDHNASVELWDRYRRGERNVFTRRLYTIKGQQTFDEIRRKYQTDSEFRSAVDRYVSDFEKLLQDVAVNDRDSIMSQTYLTSDTGKVYTMLAHASGRIR